MRNRPFQITACAIALSLSITVFSLAQPAQKDLISERNVRAAMTFLASDAMQGRGSGTPFERVTAEYVGSQFMAFGLEPAGDAVAGGGQSFVQAVTITRNSFAANPTVKYGSVSLEHGKEIIVLRTNAGSISGELQRLAAGEKPRAGAAVLLKPGEGDDPRKLMEMMQSLSAAGASLILVEETPQWRSNWANMAGRRISFTGAAGTAKPFAMIVLSTDAAAALSQAAAGTRVEFGGELAPVQTQQTWNAAGKITGTDKVLGSEVVLLSSHLDHLGVRANAPGDDKIFNGADDDASGTIAVMELARLFGEGKRPKRTIYFVCFGSEEAGGFGSSHFVNTLPFPQEKLIANLQFEMIGRPDAKVKPEELWLTGYDRSNLGAELARRGAKLVQDPHPQENFFQRSDNYTLARRGIVAHTVSSFGLHTDYHKASDEIGTIDFAHLTRSIGSMAEPLRWLANSEFRPAWNEGKKP